MGKVQVKTEEETILVPTNNKVVLPEYEDSYQVKLYLTVEAGYTVKDYTVGEETNLVPEDNIILIPVTSDEDIDVTINFEAIKYPILAYFNGIPEPVEADENNIIFVPDGWPEGIGFVDFKIKVCEVDGEFQPDNGITECDPDSQFLSEIHWIQDLSNDNGYYLIQGGSRLFIFENFSELGKAIFKLSRPGYDFEATVTIVTKNLINVKADSPIEMAYDDGSIATNETEVTSSNTGIVSIFFGNTETTLIATDPNVEGIVSLTGANYTLNEDNSVTVQLPPLTKAMVIPVELTIKLSDDSTVKKTINIKRTAIEMAYIDKKVRGGYVMNKGYLYNNQPHNDEIFDAYLQVVLYRDDKVLGYRQVQIDDEEIINSLEPNERGRIELLANVLPTTTIILFEKDSVKGVNKVGVFLTNGPMDFESDTLPSIAFGFGEGEVYEWNY